MKYNFDEEINRSDTYSLKYDFAAERGKPEGLIPLWVADMDFKTAPPVAEALIKSARHGIFGYSEAKRRGPYFAALYKWFNERFGFVIKPEWVIKTPGVVYGLCCAIKAYTAPGDAVLIQPPVYYPFKESVLDNERRLAENALVYKNGKYTIDFEDFEAKIINENVKLFMLCSPHNPVGRVWTADELTRMGDICQKHGVIVASDEIHADFVYKPHKHTVFYNLNNGFINNSLILTSPSKTFNLAGLQTANIIIADRTLRNKFRSEIYKTGYSQLNTMGLVSCQAAYDAGGQWADELVAYIEGNYRFAKEFIGVNLPKIKLTDLEGTYLIWLDMSAYGLPEPELDKIITEKAGLWVDNGSMFGETGSGFIRINIACPRNTLKKAFERLREAFAN